MHCIAETMIRPAECKTHTDEGFLAVSTKKRFEITTYWMIIATVVHIILFKPIDNRYQFRLIKLMERNWAVL